MHTSSPLLTDTSPAAAAVQLRLLREATPARRLQIALRLSSEVRALAVRAIACAHPEASPRERALLFARVHYGAAVARNLADHWRRDAAV